LYSLGLRETGFILILLGIIIVVVAFLLIILKNRNGKSKIKGGGVILLGPIPIIFGTDKEAVKTIILLSILLIVTFLIASIVFHYLLK
jgi:uncharacterized protein (TIGR00304 family)